MKLNKSQKTIACFVGAGYSFLAGVPLARDLLKRRYVLAMSDRARNRFEAVLDHYEAWQRRHPSDYPEQYLGALYAGQLGLPSPPWKWAVEYVSAVVASAGTPPTSLNRNPRYSNRVNRPSACTVHGRFWDAVSGQAEKLAVLTTNYDILIERAVRHRKMKRPPSPGCFYGGLQRPQVLKGAAQPFSVRSPERFIEMSGTVPVFKLHGSLNWSLQGGDLAMYQDLRAAYRNGGNAAIIPPVPEKNVPPWLQPVWKEAEQALRTSLYWVICGYSLPPYDAEVNRLLKAASAGRPLTIFLLSPESGILQARWKSLAPAAKIIPISGLPGGMDTYFISGGKSAHWWPRSTINSSAKASSSGSVFAYYVALLTESD